jgi:hypothetical protein
MSRCFWRWQHKYCQPKRAGIAPFFQVVVGSMIFFYAINYGKTSECLNDSQQQQPDDFFFDLFRAPQKLQVSLIDSMLLQHLSNSRFSNIG